MIIIVEIAVFHYTSLTLKTVDLKSKINVSLWVRTEVGTIRKGTPTTRKRTKAII